MRRETRGAVVEIKLLMVYDQSMLKTAILVIYLSLYKIHSPVCQNRSSTHTVLEEAAATQQTNLDFGTCEYSRALCAKAPCKAGTHPLNFPHQLEMLGLLPKALDIILRQLSRGTRVELVFSVEAAFCRR